MACLDVTLEDEDSLGKTQCVCMVLGRGWVGERKGDGYKDEGSIGKR